MSVKKLPSHKEKTSKMKGEETKDIQATMEETVGGVTGDDDALLETRARWSRRNSRQRIFKVTSEAGTDDSLFAICR